MNTPWVKKKFTFIFWTFVLSLLNISALYAQTFVHTNPNASTGGTSGSLGNVADNLSGASNLFISLFNTLFYAIGFVFVFGSLIRYREHRMNPSQTPISKVIFLLLAGLAIGFLPLIASFLGTKFAKAA